MPEETLTSELQPFVDDISIGDDRETMIKVEHITMEFNMASERLNSLKEYAIAIAKRNLFFEKLTALDDVSFEVKKGDVFGILGTNGSGKSTLLKIIAGVLAPTKGTCKINGNIAPLIELGAGFDMELSARENIFLNGSLLGYSRDFIENHFDDIVSFAEIEKFLDMPMKNYSSGMVARIAFAIATIIVPEILIVDEVLSVGDFMFQKKCEDRINELIERHGVTVLIVSHSNDQITRLCNKAIWIEKGHTRISGDATQVCNAYRILGGRKGSKKSEEAVFKALKYCESSFYKSIPNKIITGDNHIQVSANIALNGWSENACEAVFLVPDYSHLFSIIASSVSGALKAPVISFCPDSISLHTLNAIRKLNPKKIILIGYEDDLVDLETVLSSQFSDKTIAAIKSKRSIDSIHQELSKFATEHNLWSTFSGFLIPFDNRNECFQFAVKAYSEKVPIFLYFESGMNLDKQLTSLLSHSLIKTLYVSDSLYNKLGMTEDICPFSIKPLTNYAISSLDDANDQNSAIGNYKTPEIVISDGSDSQWQNMISVPSYVGYTNRSLIQRIPSSLDNAANCLATIRQKDPSQITIINSNSFSSLEIKMLTCDYSNS